MGRRLVFSFGHIGDGSNWERILPFDATVAERLLVLLREQGQRLRASVECGIGVGPDSEIGAALIPELFRAVCAAAAPGGGSSSNKPTLLYTEWRPLSCRLSALTPERIEGLY